MNTPPETDKPAVSVDFIRTIVADDIKNGKNAGRVHTRFPPEPNGYLHIGHAKSICLNFGIAREFGGKCNLRFDDTNPTKEDVEYVDSIKEDIRWLGFDWEGRELYASDYFEQLYSWAEHLIQNGKAYVDSLEPDKIREYRGTLTEPGKASPDRDRLAAESLEMFRKMRAGDYPDGALVLRAKVDMASPNLNLRDPILYRIRRAHHHRTGDKWCIYPMYDFAHGQSDAIEGITHSVCTLEFENHRPLYDWFLDNLPAPCHPRQIEFARLNLTYTVMSKRKLLKLVQEGRVSGWDDPRMPTLTGLRRRGFTPEAIRSFADKIGVAKRDSIVDVALLEHCVREDLNARAPRVMAVLRPLRVVLENYPEGETEYFELPVNPDKPELGVRKVPFARELFIERDDFMEAPPKKFFRLAPGREVRLRGGFFIKCTGVEKDPSTGEITSLRCTYDPATRGGVAPDGRKVKVTIHWVACKHAIDAEVRLYDRLFTDPEPGAEREGQDFTTLINPGSLEVLKGCKLEHTASDAEPESRWQFERLGYFCADRRDCKRGALVFNRTVSLKSEKFLEPEKKPDSPPAGVSKPRPDAKK